MAGKPKADRLAFRVACAANILLALSVLSLHAQLEWLRGRVVELEAEHPTLELPEEEGE